MRGESQRAFRFGIRVPVLYRPKGATDWLEGMTVNISRTGLLLHVPEISDSGTRLDMVFTLPLKVGASQGTRVACAGFVTRAAEAAEEFPPAMGIQFSNFILTSVPPRQPTEGRPICDRMN